MNRSLERAKYILALVLYGTIGLFLRHVSLPSEIVAMCRGAIGSLFIFLYLQWKKKAIPDTARPGMEDNEAVRKNLPWLIASGICLGLNWIFLFAAYTHTTVAIASLCNYTAPIILILVAPVLLRETLDRRKLPCVAGAVAGIVLVSGVWGGEIGNISGVFMGLAGALGFVGVVICNRKISGISPMDKSIIQLAVSALTILPYVLVKNYGVSLEWDARSVIIILILGIVHTGFAYCLYFSGLSTLPVQTIAILGYLEPVVSVLCSAFFLHEPMGISGWIGAALILGSAILCESMGEPGERQASGGTFPEKGD